MMHVHWKAESANAMACWPDNMHLLRLHRRQIDQLKSKAQTNKDQDVRHGVEGGCERQVREIEKQVRTKQG